jgi:hypothetical protein
MTPALTHLQRLEAEGLFILREVVAECAMPVMLYSLGKAVATEGPDADNHASEPRRCRHRSRIN